METFYLTRKEMSQLLLSLQGKLDKTPLSILQETWVKSHQEQIQVGKSPLGAFIATSLPPIFEKLIKSETKRISFSLNEIVALGSQIEYSHFAVSSVQNWVKRDFKELIGAPEIGKKYSIQQAAILFIIEDLKSALDFESIRKLLILIFHESSDQSKDLLTPVELYAGYAAIFEELDRNNDQVMDLTEQGRREVKHDDQMEKLIKQKADLFCDSLCDLNREQREAVSNTLVIAILSVQTAYFQSLAKRFLNAALFLHNLK